MTNPLSFYLTYLDHPVTILKLHELDDSIINLRISLNKYKKYLGKHALEVADTHFILGNVYKKMSNFKEAVEYHRKALAIREGFIS